MVVGGAPPLWAAALAIYTFTSIAAPRLYRT